MDKQEIQRKVDELKAVLMKHKNDLGEAEKALMDIVSKYHAVVKEENLKELKESIKKIV